MNTPRDDAHRAQLNMYVVRLRLAGIELLAARRLAWYWGQVSLNPANIQFEDWESNLSKPDVVKYCNDGWNDNSSVNKQYDWK